MFGLGPPELLLLFVVILLVFGVGKLPAIGSNLGKGLRNFKKAVKGEEEEESEPPPPSDSKPSH
ncbi:MAG TPA: twin-arginine translocase TatA/TatE family subunit [Deltaproteobacteria bacterium]|nr:twin-arginine translocase TatA/TatE family subunit [Deltaproteobacteria bacterium]